jgi:hypothetical protein
MNSQVAFGQPTFANRSPPGSDILCRSSKQAHIDPLVGDHGMGLRTLILLSCVWALVTDRLPAQDRNAKVRNDRMAFQSSKDWIYDDLAEGRRVAQEAGKPMLVVFRCIPCEACQQFDDEVARRDPVIRDLMDKFVCVRIVQANRMDLSHFQFDFDQSFAIFLMNPDLTIYGRFGTRSDRPESQDISLEGLHKAMAEALRMHRNLSAYKQALAGKQVKPSRFKTPRDYPSLSARYGPGLDYAGNVAGSCIHCHQIRDAEREVWRSTGEPLPDEILFPYPDPEVLGLRMEPDELAKVTQVIAGSAAARAELKPHDEIISVDAQRLLSVADLQWVLQNAPATGSLPLEVRRGGKTVELTLKLAKGWRRGNISWRTTTWELRRIGLGGMKLECLDEEGLRRAGLSRDQMALRAVHVGEFGDHAVAKRAGFRKGDIIVSFGGVHARTTESELLAHALQRLRRGDDVSTTVVRDGKRTNLSFKLP